MKFRRHISFPKYLTLLFLLTIVIVLSIVVFIITKNTQRYVEQSNTILTIHSQQLDNKQKLKDLQFQQNILTIIKENAKGYLTEEEIGRVMRTVLKQSEKYNIDPYLILAMIRVESTFNPNAKGIYKNGKPSGAYGLMQVKYSTAQEIAKKTELSLSHKKELLSPVSNIKFGTAYLHKMLKKFKNEKLAILAYNQGPTTILRHKGKETLSTQYYTKVKKFYHKYTTNEDISSSL